MLDWKKTAIKKDSKISEALYVLKKTGTNIVLVVDEQDHLLGVVTDSDIRSGLLRGVTIDQSVSQIYNTSPITAHKSDDLSYIHTIMKNSDVPQIPVLDSNKKIIRLELLREFLKSEVHDNVVVLMAGGKGLRLRPLTTDCPKPMLKIGEQPILEVIIKKLITYGFNRFYISVNYKSEIIENYFSDGSKWNIEIKYLREKKTCGTAGSLSLLPKTIEKPIMLMNADLLTTINFKQLLEYHEENNSNLTMCVRNYEYQVPFGVVNIEDNKLVSIEEKPTHLHFVNAGIYVLNPETCQFIPKSRYFDMTDLLNLLLSKNLSVSVYPVGEYWMDIGRKNDYQKANEDVHLFIKDN